MFNKIKKYGKQRYTFMEHMYLLSRWNLKNYYLSDFRPKIKTQKKKGIWTCIIKSYSFETSGENKSKFMARQEAMEKYIKLVNHGRLLRIPCDFLLELPSACVSIPAWDHPFFWKEYDALSVWDELVGDARNPYDYIDFSEHKSAYEMRMEGIGECPVCHSEVPSGVFACPKCGMLCGATTRKTNNENKEHLEENNGRSII